MKHDNNNATKVNISEIIVKYEAMDSSFVTALRISNTYVGK